MLVMPDANHGFIGRDRGSRGGLLAADGRLIAPEQIVACAIFRMSMSR